VPVPATRRSEQGLLVKAGGARADSTDVSIDNGSGDSGALRCPRCAALARPGSQWCTLCYADLRPPPEPAFEPAPEPAPEGSASEVFTPGLLDPLTAPLALLERQEPAPNAQPLATATTATTAATADAAASPVARGWPCIRCGAVAPFTETTCPACGAAFLEGAPGNATPLDRLVSGAASDQTKLLIMVGGGLGLLVLLLGLMYLFGTVF